MSAPKFGTVPLRTTRGHRLTASAPPGGQGRAVSGRRRTGHRYHQPAGCSGLYGWTPGGGGLRRLPSPGHGNWIPSGVRQPTGIGLAYIRQVPFVHMVQEVLLRVGRTPLVGGTWRPSFVVSPHTASKWVWIRGRMGFALVARPPGHARRPPADGSVVLQPRSPSAILSGS